MEENKKVELTEESEKRVAKAVAKEVGSGSVFHISIRDIISLILVAVILIGGYSVYNKVNKSMNSLNSLFSFDSGASAHDLVLEDNGVLGYLAADFQEAILGNASQKKEVVVYSREVSDVATITKTGLLNWSAFSKSQLITYKGTVDYYVDLSNFSASNIAYDEESNTVTMLIPHAQRKDININEKDVEYADVEKGLLAFGDLNANAQQWDAVKAEARKKMEQKLEDEKVGDEADRFAKLTIWEIYSPIVKSVGKDVSLVVEFVN